MEMGIKGQKPSLFLSLILIVTILTDCLQTAFLSDVVTPTSDNSRNTILRWERPKFIASETFTRVVVPSFYDRLRKCSQFFYSDRLIGGSRPTAEIVRRP
jgi:hypothetical protein